MVKAVSHGAICLATCNAILLLRDVNKCRMFDFMICEEHISKLL